MAVQEWELQNYQMAASAVVQRLGGNPTEPVEWPDGSIKPLWMLQATKMHELRLMQQAMADYGPYGPL